MKERRYIMMKVTSMQGTGALPTNSGNQTTQNDEISKNLLQQIASYQKQLQELPTNESMSPEAKMKKRQEIMKEMAKLNQQLQQRQMELRKEQQAEHDPVSELSGQTKPNQMEGKEGGISRGRMEAMISADTSLKQAKVQESVGTRLESRAAILKTEIQQDKGSGADTTHKEAELDKLQSKAMSITKEQMSALEGVNRKLKESDVTEEKTEDAEEKTEDAHRFVKNDETSSFDRTDQTDINIPPSDSYQGMDVYV
jgi:hypothetical protein